MKPSEVLDMSLDTLRVCVDGYSERLFDLEILGVHQGYWSGYYAGAKKPKPLKTVIESLYKVHTKITTDKATDKKSKSKPEVDVEAFLATEAAFKERQSKLRL